MLLSDKSKGVDTYAIEIRSLSQSLFFGMIAGNRRFWARFNRCSISISTAAVAGNVPDQSHSPAGHHLSMSTSKNAILSGEHPTHHVESNATRGDVRVHPALDSPREMTKPAQHSFCRYVHASSIHAVWAVVDNDMIHPIPLDEATSSCMKCI